MQRFAARGSGRMLGNRSADVRVGIGDLRTGEFTLQADTIGGLDQVLAFLNSAPLIARYLGEDFARLEAPSGTGAVSLDLAVPLRNRAAYRLTAGLDIIDGELAYRGFGPHVTEIQGSLALADGVLRGEGVQGDLPRRAGHGERRRGRSARLSRAHRRSKARSRSTPSSTRSTCRTASCSPARRVGRAGC